MGEAQPTLLPPNWGTLTPATPSGLTPNTRSEAEAALTHNITTQTDSAAPTTPLPASHTNMYPGMGAEGGNAMDGEADDRATEAQKAYRRPPGLIRTSSANYAHALQQARKQSSASSELDPDTQAHDENITGTMTASPASTALPFPLPGQGVVPLHTGVGSGQTEVVKKAKPSGLSLGQLMRQQSFSEQDMKHLLQGRLMSPVKGDAGYDSGTEERAVRPS